MGGVGGNGTENLERISQNYFNNLNIGYNQKDIFGEISSNGEMKRNKERLPRENQVTELVVG